MVRCCQNGIRDQIAEGCLIGGRMGRHDARVALLSLDHQADESPLFFHPGALRYYAEKGLKIK